MRRGVLVITCLTAVTAGCGERFENYQLVVSKTEGRSLAAQFGAVTAKLGMGCEDLSRSLIRPGEAPQVPGEAFCRDWETMVDMHAVFEPQGVKVDIRAVSGAGPKPLPGKKALDALMQAFAKVAKGENMVVTNSAQ